MTDRLSQTRCLLSIRNSSGINWCKPFTQILLLLKFCASSFLTSKGGGGLNQNSLFCLICIAEGHHCSVILCRLAAKHLLQYKPESDLHPGRRLKEASLHLIPQPIEINQCSGLQRVKCARKTFSIPSRCKPQEVPAGRRTAPPVA